MLRRLALAACLIFSPALPAATLSWSVNLAPEVTGATGSGSGLIRFNTDTRLLHFDFSFSGLSGVTTVAHLHCCTASPSTGTAGVAVDAPTLAGFPVGVSSGSYSGSFDLDLVDSWGGGFLNNAANQGSTALATASLLAGMDDGLAYLNVHSNRFPAGEIRSFTQRVPLPGSLVLLAAGLLALAIGRRRA